jgi:hypothetical protein
MSPDDIGVREMVNVPVEGTPLAEVNENGLSPEPRILTPEPIDDLGVLLAPVLLRTLLPLTVDAVEVGVVLASLSADELILSALVSLRIFFLFGSPPLLSESGCSDAGVVVVVGPVSEGGRFIAVLLVLLVKFEVELVDVDEDELLVEEDWRFSTTGICSLSDELGIGSKLIVTVGVGAGGFGVVTEVVAVGVVVVVELVDAVAPDVVDDVVTSCGVCV